MANFCSVFKAILTRLLFIVHSLITIWRATTVLGPLYWSLAGTLGGMLIELIIVISVNKGEEWKWLCPSVFFYLASVVPSLWIVELDRINMMMQGVENNSSTSTVAFAGFEFSMELSANDWAQALEQAMMVLLIVGRWLLPKGELTRSQLSQLLLVYLALAADMIDFFTIFAEENALRSQIFIYVVLAVWSWSLLQFTVVLTATKSRRARVISPEERRRELEVELELDDGDGTCKCCETELWAILMTTFMQDGPYFALRLVALFYFNIFSYTIIFFTCKNGMILLLQLYRLVVTSAELKKIKLENYKQELDNQAAEIASVEKDDI